MKKILNYLCISEFGLIEFLLALYPILCGYKVGGIILSYGLIAIIAVLAVVKRGVKPFAFKPFLYFGGYVIIHNIIYMGIIDNVSMASGFVNNTIGMAIIVISCRYIAPVVEFKKLYSAISVISIVCVLGLLYHVIQLATGHTINTIPIPFLPDQGVDSRLVEEHYRATSFFFEPQSYIMYVLIPFYYFITNKKYLVATIIGVSMLLSGSTTGIVVLLIILASFFLTKNQSITQKAVIVVFAFLAAYFLVSSEYTQVGLDKMSNTDLSTDIRTASGPLLLRTMDLSYLLTGAPYASATQMAEQTGNSYVVFLNDSVYIPAFWNALIFYGLIGLFLFLNIYWAFWKKFKSIRPYVACIVACMFSNPDFLSATMVYALMFMISFYVGYSNLEMEN